MPTSLDEATAFTVIDNAGNFGLLNLQAACYGMQHGMLQPQTLQHVCGIRTFCSHRATMSPTSCHVSTLHC